MVELQCPVPGCEYQTPAGSSETVACTLLSAHSTIHMGGGRARIPSGPKLDRLKVDSGLNQEEWNLFLRRWEAFVIGSGLDANNCSTQLFQCASQSLGDSLLRSNPRIIDSNSSLVGRLMIRGFERSKLSPRDWLAHWNS
jgi:hypothetical protein